MDRPTPQGSRWRLMRIAPRLVLLALALSTIAVPSSRASNTTHATSAAAVAVDHCCPCPERSEDRFWLIDTRCLPCPSATVFDPRVRQYDHRLGWVPRDVGELVESSSQLTIVYVHGNRISDSAAIDRGWDVYSAIVTADTPPVRFVIWSWPSDQIRGQLRDVRAKAYRATGEGIFLAQFLNMFPEHPPVSLIGHSYGSRVIGGALHILGGGVIDGSGLEHQASGPTQHWLRAVLVAPAVDRDAFAPGRIFQNANDVVERPLILFNPCDPVLKRYGIINNARRRDQAIGFVGLASNGGLNADQFNVSGYIGRSHDEMRYLQSGPVMNTVRPYLLWQESR